MKFYIIDAFTKTLFGGNPAGVVILDEGRGFPSDDTMRRTAAELRYSETAFIKQLDQNMFHIRYFTPASEVDLCGHATIASFAALAEAGLASDGGGWICRTLAGDLKIELRQGFVMMEMGPPEYRSSIDEPGALDELYSILGIPYKPAAAALRNSRHVDLLPSIVSTGLPDIVLPVKDRSTLAAIKPDFAALAKLSEKYRVTGVHAFTLDCEACDITAHCRNFAPLYDIDEEAATGTANGALTYYLFQHGLILDGAECVFVQGEAMRRPSQVFSQISIQDAGPKIQVGGSAAILASGDIFI